MAFLLVISSFFISSASQPVLAQEAPAIGDKVVQQGTVSSDVDPLKGHEGHQAAVILPPRNDSALYAVLWHLQPANQFKLPRSTCTMLIMLRLRMQLKGLELF
jgi:hypothetical protein